MNFNKIISFFILFNLFLSCAKNDQKKLKNLKSSVTLKILGTIQDGGIPHLGCKKDCCKKAFQNGVSKNKVVSLGVSDLSFKKSFLIEASPDITVQLKDFLNNEIDSLDGIFITHAHIGHYSGLINLGREVFNTSNIPLFLMPKMTDFIKSNGPWNQLLKLNNVELKPLFNAKEEKLTKNLTITPFLVPHRDEYSETVGFEIKGPNRKAIFIPDIDKWEKWDQSIVDYIKEVDYAFIDGTFYSEKEVKGRDITEIPHPLITESIRLFENLNEDEKNKVYFIHLNHTNPLIDKKSVEFKYVRLQGFNVAEISSVFYL